MKLKFKQQAFQTDAVKAVVNCFAGQPKADKAARSYKIDSGKESAGETRLLHGIGADGFANPKLGIPPAQLLENLQGVQRRHNLPISLTSYPPSAVTAA